MIRACMIIVCLSLFADAGAQTFPTFHSTADLSLTSPGASRFGLYGYDNPALLTYASQPDFMFVWTHNAAGSWNDFNRWGIFNAWHDFGLGIVKTKAGDLSITDYRLSAAFGDRNVGFGMAYGFTGGNKGAFNRSNVFTMGTIIRPGPYVSAGLVGSVGTTGGNTEGAVDFGIRPTGTEALTLFADYAIRNDQRLREGGWSVGAAVEPLQGILITGRFFDTHAFTIGLSLSFGSSGVTAGSTWDNSSRHQYNTYGIRLGALERTEIPATAQRTHYATIDLRGGMRYQRYLFFDSENTLRDMLNDIRQARDDASICGLAINTSGMHIGREMTWELREALRDFRSAEKSVVVFIDRPSMEAYRFATAADRIVMDPTGIILLPGYTMGNTYYKGTLEKLGLAFDEWRYFTYKSANEPFARDSMSAPDREQKQAYVNDLYEQTRKEICEGRGLSTARYDEIVNDEVMFLARDAVREGLVDTLGRWELVPSIMRDLEGRHVSPVSAAALRSPVSERWGEPPHIAVVYALGVCAMDEGINARSLSKDVDRVADDPQVKAIVLRVDSPGGDGMASDYVAEALLRAKKKKPVIVSQGAVAASGGYWLSMYADTIVAAPSTITGSIGVIGGWLYNTGLKQTLGMSTDHVKAGEHADLGFGFTVPLLGMTVPDRDLTAEEQQKAKRAITTYYEDFIRKVAAGRNTTPEKIDSVGQGRFYSGVDGKTAGLVDVLGGLTDAIAIARLKAGISPDAEATIIELPQPGLFNIPRFFPRAFGVDRAIGNDPLLRHLRFRLQFNGQPMPLMPLDSIDLYRED